uniref:Uncharacterized protein n=1 Tax=Cacopsylla melanoneura TaxID=428564 RepID=A0A8D8Z7Q9_9HEMI
MFSNFVYTLSFFILVRTLFLSSWERKATWTVVFSCLVSPNFMVTIFTLCWMSPELNPAFSKIFSTTCSALMSLFLTPTISTWLLYSLCSISFIWISIFLILVFKP